jgi:chromosome segregation ATPase
LKKDLEKLEANNKSMQFTIGSKNSTISQNESQISLLNARVAELEAIILSLNNELKTIGDAHKTAQEQLTAAKKRCDVLESTVKVRSNLLYSPFKLTHFLPLRQQFKNVTQLKVSCLIEIMR